MVDSDGAGAVDSRSADYCWSNGGPVYLHVLLKLSEGNDSCLKPL